MGNNTKVTIRRRLNVQSSAIEAIGYDVDTWTLEVAFTSGSVYRYGTVPPTVFAEMVNAESIGKFHARHIVDTFDYEDITNR